MPEADVRPVTAPRTSGRRGRRHGIEIKPGSVKQARKDAGLSLGQVANGAVSRTAIYFVETGKAKPSMETLRLIAERTGQPLDYFLVRPSTMEPRWLSALGSVHATTQDWQAAIDCYERAIAAGEVVQDLRRLSLMYSGLSLAYSEIGQLGQAAYYAQRALTIHETLNDRLSLARSENNLGNVLIKRGDLAAADEHLSRALALWDEADLEVGRADVLLSMCDLAIARSLLDDAERLAVEARDFAERLSEQATLPDSTN